MYTYIEVKDGAVRYIGTGPFVPASFQHLQIVDVTNYTGSITQGDPWPPTP